MLQAIKISIGDDGVKWIVLSPTFDAAEIFANKILKLKNCVVTNEKNSDSNCIIFDYIIDHKAEVIYPLPEPEVQPKDMDAHRKLEQISRQINSCTKELWELLKSNLNGTQLAFCSLKFLHERILEVMENMP